MNKKLLFAYLLPVLLIFLGLGVYFLLKPVITIEDGRLQKLKISVPKIVQKKTQFTKKANEEEGPFREISINNNTDPSIVKFNDFLKNEMRYWDTTKWNYETDYTFGVISIENSVIYYKPTIPSSEQLFSQLKYPVSLTCNPDKTIFLTVDRKVVESGEEADYYFNRGPTIVYTKCNDNKCTSLGPFCAIIAFPAEK